MSAGGGCFPGEEQQVKAFEKVALPLFRGFALAHWSLRSRPFTRVRKQSFGLLRLSPHMSLKADFHKGLKRGKAPRPLDPPSGKRLLGLTASFRSRCFQGAFRSPLGTLRRSPYKQQSFLLGFPRGLSGRPLDPFGGRLTSNNLFVLGFPRGFPVAPWNPSAHPFGRY